MTYNRKSRDATSLTTTTAAQGYGITNIHCAPPPVRYARNKPVKFESYGEVFCQTAVKPKVSEVTSAKFSRRQDRQTSLHRSHSSSLLGKEEEIKTEEIVPRRKRAEPVLYRRATEIMTKWDSGPIVAHKYESDYDDSALLDIKKKTFKVEEDNLLRDYERRKAEKAKAAEREEERAARAKEEKLALIRSTPSTPSPTPKQLSTPSPTPKQPSTPTPAAAVEPAPAAAAEPIPAVSTTPGDQAAEDGQ
eukprot:sb/3468809/